MKQFIIVELDDDGSVLESWLVLADSVKEALNKFALHTDLNNMMEDYIEDFVDRYDEDTHRVEGDYSVIVYDISQMQTIK